jgi:hypothetical protein
LTTFDALEPGRRLAIQIENAAALDSACAHDRLAVEEHEYLP